MGNKTIYRKDIISGKLFPREQLLRLVYSEKGILIDKSFSLKGRGAYIKLDKKNLTCLKSAKLLNRAFRKQIDPAFIASFLEEINNER